MTDRSSRGDATAKARRSVSLKLVVATVIAILAIVFVLQNTQRGRVEFLFWDVSAPAWLWLLLLFAAGVVVGSFLPWMRRRRR